MSNVKNAGQLLCLMAFAMAGTAFAQTAQPMAPSKPLPAATPMTPPAATAPAAAAVEQDSGYVLGSDDVIDVKVLGQPEFAAAGRIEVDGSLNIQFIGTTKVSGETPLTLSRKIADKLREGGYYTKPIVTVTVISFASRNITVLGEFVSPGQFSINRVYRLSEIVARVGGIRPSGADYVDVIRPNGEKRRIKFETLATGFGDQDPIVYAGDKLYVPPAETYYISGQVNQPGNFPIKEQPLTLRKALARSGGMTPLGSAKRIEVFRNGKPEKMAMEAVIQPGDVVVIGERPF